MGLFSSVLGNKKKGQSNAGVFDWGKQLYNSGAATSDAAVAGVNSDIADSKAMIAGGGLTPALRRSFDVARGNVLDRATAQRGGLQANLAQTNLASGGTLGPQAIAELQAGGNESIGANEFAATNDVNAQQADLGFQSTNSLLGRIADARKTVLGAGNFRQGLGAAATSGALSNMNDIRKSLLGIL